MVKMFSGVLEVITEMGLGGDQGLVAGRDVIARPAVPVTNT